MAIGIRAGRLKKRIQIQTKTETRGRTGGFLEAWSIDSTVWGAIEPLTGKEVEKRDQIDARVTHFIFLRYKGGIKTHFRLREGGDIYNVVRVINKDSRNWQLEIWAEWKDFAPAILMENGEFMLTEDGRKILME